LEKSYLKPPQNDKTKGRAGRAIYHACRGGIFDAQLPGYVRWFTLSNRLCQYQDPFTSKPRSVEADMVAHCGDTTAVDYVKSLTFTGLLVGGQRTSPSETRAAMPSSPIRGVEPEVI
jgi:hypothetical protein